MLKEEKEKKGERMKMETLIADIAISTWNGRHLQRAKRRRTARKGTERVPYRMQI